MLWDSKVAKVSHVKCVRRKCFVQTGLWALEVWPLNWCQHWRTEVGTTVPWSAIWSFVPYLYIYIYVLCIYNHISKILLCAPTMYPSKATILCGKSHNIFVLLWLLLRFLMTCLLYCNCRSMVSATIRDHQRQPLQQPHAKLERPKHAKTKNLMKPVITCLFQVKTWPLCMDTRVVYRRQS